MNLSFTMIRRMGNTGDLSEFPGPVHQASKRGTWNAVCLRDSPQAHSSEHRSHSSKVAMETSLLFCSREHGGIKSWTRKTNVGIKGEISFVSSFCENGVKSDIFERTG